MVKCVHFSWDFSKGQGANLYCNVVRCRIYFSCAVWCIYYDVTGGYLDTEHSPSSRASEAYYANSRIEPSELIIMNDLAA